MPTQNTHQLAVVDSLPGVVEQAEQAYKAEIPGFQINKTFAKKIGLVPVMDSIEEGSVLALGDRIPFTARPDLYNEPGHYPPHTDGNFRGMSIHHNQAGSGHVQLAHLLDGTQPEAKDGRMFIGPETENYRFYKGPGIVAVDVEHGPIFEGEIEPDKLTIFSEGNIEGLPPAIHYFNRSGGGGWWTRYGSGFEDREDDPDTLDEISKHFKNGIVWSDYNGLAYDMRTIQTELKQGNGVLPDWVRRSMRSGLAPEEVKDAMRSHPGKHIVPLGFKYGLGLTYKKYTPVGHTVHNAKQLAIQAAHDTVKKIRGGIKPRSTRS